MTRQEMARILYAAPDSPMNATYNAALSGICANPSLFEQCADPAQGAVEFALDVCIADMRASEPQTQRVQSSMEGK